MPQTFCLKMFDVREHDLTWEIVGNWPTEYTDADFSVCLPNPRRKVDASACKTLDHYYFLKGSELLYFTMNGDTVDDVKLRFKTIIDLSEIGLHTKPLATDRPPSILNLLVNGSSFRTDILGEIFYRKDDYVSDSFLSFVSSAFTVYYPPKNCANSAIDFCTAVKRRVFKIRAEQGSDGKPDTVVS